MVISRSKGIALIFVLPLLYFACGKKDATTPAKTDTSKTNPTGGTGTTTNPSACNTKVGDVESLEIFPADNSWNQDISTAAVDPYSAQIIATISTSHLKADFGSRYMKVCPSASRLMWFAEASLKLR